MAAKPVRLPLRVWSMKTLPSSMVNSKSCTSRKWLSRVLRTRSNSVGGFGHDFGQFGHRLGRAHARHHVFALGVDEEFAVEHLFAAGRVARESNAGTGAVARIAKDHGLDIDRRSPFGGDIIFAAINYGAIIHPGTKDSADGAFELLPGIGRETPGPSAP